MPASSDPNQQDLEIKDVQVIFRSVWETLEEEVGHANLRFPKELILLGGAPGSGKGTQTRFIMNGNTVMKAPALKMLETKFIDRTWKITLC